MSYTESFKENAVSKLLAPGSLSLAATAKKLEIPASTLFGWKEKYGNKASMKKTKRKSTHSWSAEQKLEAIVRTSSMNENELGEYLRAHGLHSDDLETFKKELTSSVSAKGRPKIDPEIIELRNANKRLERELKRNTAALAEQSARIILLKKSHEIWGVKEGEE